MREIAIGKNESGQRLDKYLQKYLREASKGFIYKMLRKKNIKLNGQKAEGREMLRQGDRVTIYFSEETLCKFCGGAKSINYPVTELSLVYEDDNIVLINKPAGMLSQKAKDSDTTLVEYFLGYLQQSGQWQPGGAFTPGICNRLDRNTSGIVIAGKSLAGLQKMSQLLKERTLDKYYLAIVEGVMTEPAVIRGYLSKEEGNRAVIYAGNAPGRSYIETAYEPVQCSGAYTLLRVKLVTGKTHQIRAHLAGMGHPLAGDVKYGGRRLAGQRSYFLHAAEIHFPDMEGEFSGLGGQVFRAPLPRRFAYMKEKFFESEEDKL